MSSNGIVFDLQRCSMHDGPGVRTTVFLKGCPLHCLWCHNPESQSFSPQMAFFAEKCVDCRRCEAVCPAGVHHWKEGNHTVDFSKCTHCGACLSICPQEALKCYGTQMSVQQVLEIVRRDFPFYAHTGGGITLSGGEPFFQFSFCLKLLQNAKAEGIHTCVETSGYVSAQNLRKAAPYIDYFLFDYKESSEENHRRFTGVDLRVIRKRFIWLYENGKPIRLRCPIVPGYNNTNAHLQNICKMERDFPLLDGIEILPYHDFGRSKALSLGKTYPVTADGMQASDLQILKEQLSRFGASEKLLSSF